MINHRMPAWTVVAGVAVAAVFFAGFFQDGAAADPARLRSEEMTKAKRLSGSTLSAHNESAECAAGDRDMISRTAFAVPANLFRRAGEFSCRVDSVIKTYEDIDKRLVDFGGEITEMEIVGNDDGRQGRISCTVATDKFNPCVAYLRGLGKILSERITASSKPKGGRQGVKADPDEPDPRELSLISIQVLDERSAKEVTASKGLLAGSFDRSTSHFIGGLAVIVEGLGWIAPYVFMLAIVAAPFGIARLIRRRAQPVTA